MTYTKKEWGLKTRFQPYDQPKFISVSDASPGVVLEAFPKSGIFKKLKEEHQFNPIPYMHPNRSPTNLLAYIIGVVEPELFPKYIPPEKRTIVEVFSYDTHNDKQGDTDNTDFIFDLNEFVQGSKCVAVGELTNINCGFRPNNPDSFAWDKSHLILEKYLEERELEWINPYGFVGKAVILTPPSWYHDTLLPDLHRFIESRRKKHIFVQTKEGKKYPLEDVVLNCSK